MLDEAIEYLKTLQLQVQVNSLLCLPTSLLIHFEVINIQNLFVKL